MTTLEETTEEANIFSPEEEGEHLDYSWIGAQVPLVSTEVVSTPSEDDEYDSSTAEKEKEAPVIGLYEQTNEELHIGVNENPVAMCSDAEMSKETMSLNYGLNGEFQLMEQLYPRNVVLAIRGKVEYKLTELLNLARGKYSAEQPSYET
ncbi:MAG: hypothetical protein GY861_07420 [bacterium]|nr:hypothetical protein [bacterium]